MRTVTDRHLSRTSNDLLHWLTEEHQKSEDCQLRVVGAAALDQLCIDVVVSTSAALLCLLGKTLFSLCANPFIFRVTLNVAINYKI